MSETKTETDVNQDAVESETNTEESLFPVDGQWFTIATYLFLLGWMGYMVYEALGYSRQMDWLFPLVVGAPAIGLILLKLTIIRYPAIVEKALPDQSGDDESFMQVEADSAKRPRTEREKYVLYMFGWIILLPFMMFILGMGWTLLLYPLGFTWFFTRDVRLSAIVTGMVIAFVWVLFIEILELVIFTGILGLPSPLRILVELR